LVAAEHEILQYRGTPPVVLPQPTPTERALQIQISKGPLRAELLGAGKDACESVITLRAPCHFSKRDSELRLTLAPGAHKSVPVPSLVRAVAQAKTWYDWINKGEIRTMREACNKTTGCSLRLKKIVDGSPRETQLCRPIRKSHSFSS
jgi:hypothetical protein